MVPDGREVVSCGGGEMITRIYDVRKKSIFNKRKKKILKELIKDIINKKGVSNTKYVCLLVTLENPKAGKLEMKTNSLYHLLVKCLTVLAEWSSFTWDPL